MRFVQLSRRFGVHNNRIVNFALNTFKWITEILVQMVIQIF